MDWFPTQELRRKALEITECLQSTYHAVRRTDEPYFRLPPVDELMLTILSQSTTDVNSWRGYHALVERFGRWEQVAEADVPAIEETIRTCGLAKQKAPRMKAILQRLRDERGSISLEFLCEMPPDEALAYLMSFDGVGRKTASCVLLFSLGIPALPVDTHVLRVTTRLALLPEQTTADQAHDLLEALLPEDQYLSFHLNIIAHGRQTCSSRRPACTRCPVYTYCPYGTALDARE